MSVFLLPLTLCDRLERLMNRFWWGGSSSNGRKIHWLSWKRLSAPKHAGGLGFRNLHDFNIALLAKQGWRFLMKPNSLVARLFKARYFPGCSFLDAIIGHNPSFVWRSVLAGRNLLRDGLAHRIGDGEDTTIWGFPWLSCRDDPGLETNCPDHLREAKVAGLLTETKQWDVEVLNDLFIARDVSRILSTPICPSFKDVWCWKHEIRGVYTVRSGYHKLSSVAQERPAAVGFSAWKQLWLLKVPPNIRNFLWRIAKGILPVRSVLQQRGVLENACCLLCSGAVETIDHLFLECAFSKQVRNDGGPGLPGSLEGSVVACLNECLQGNNLFRAVKFAAYVWSIWRARNERLWKAVTWPATQVRFAADSMVIAWQNITTPITNPVSAAEGDHSWNPPPRNFLKCNVDAAIFAASASASFGAVVRDEHGHFVTACCTKVPYVQDPGLAEAIACREALSWLKSKGFGNIIMESDSLNFCTGFYKSSVDNSYMGLVRDHCKSIIASFGNVVVRHVYRSTNQVAHVLARAFDSYAELREWVSTPPDCISHLLS